LNANVTFERLCHSHYIWLHMRTAYYSLVYLVIFRQPCRCSLLQRHK